MLPMASPRLPSHPALISANRAPSSFLVVFGRHQAYLRCVEARSVLERDPLFSLEEREAVPCEAELEVDLPVRVSL